MRRSSVLPGVLLAAALLLPGAAAAQEADAYVLPRGMLRVGVTGIFADAESVFGPGGEALPLAADLNVPLVSGTFAPLSALESGLAALFEATAGVSGANPVQVTDATLTAGTPAVDAAMTTRVVPLEAALGVLPRVEVFARLPVVRGELLVRGFELEGATVGLDPAPDANAAVFVELGVPELAFSPVLPTADSPLGRELLARAEGQLVLPDSALTALELAAVLTELGISLGEPTGEDLELGDFSDLGDWRAGDLEVGARVRLLSTLGDRFFPADGSRGLQLRAAVTGSARLPTGAQANTLLLLPVGPEAGLSGYRVGIENDLFFGDWFWGTVGAEYSDLQESELVRRVAPLDRPLSDFRVQTTTWDPGDRLQLTLLPRLRFADALAVGGVYSLVRTGESTFSAVAEEGAAEPFFAIEGATLQRVGATLRYSTLPAFTAGASLIPLDIRLAFTTTISGGARVPDANVILVELAAFPRLWE